MMVICGRCEQSLDLQASGSTCMKSVQMWGRVIDKKWVRDTTS